MGVTDGQWEELIAAHRSNERRQLIAAIVNGSTALIAVACCAVMAAVSGSWTTTLPLLLMFCASANLAHCALEAWGYRASVRQHRLEIEAYYYGGDAGPLSRGLKRYKDGR